MHWSQVNGKPSKRSGRGVARCPPSNLRYRYRIDGPQAGQLEATLRLDEQGKPLQQERVTFDAWGRPTRVERISYISDKASKQPQKPELVLRARYEAMPQNLAKHRIERGAIRGLMATDAGCASERGDGARAHRRVHIQRTSAAGDED